MGTDFDRKMREWALKLNDPERFARSETLRFGDPERFARLERMQHLHISRKSAAQADKAERQFRDGITKETPEVMHQFYSEAEQQFRNDAIVEDKRRRGPIDEAAQFAKGIRYQRYLARKGRPKK